jgi:magnesium-transporting ATPase (P-type)
MLDEYWQYTIFTLFSIFMLEATTAFQRLRTFNTLGNMASKPTPLMVYRDAKWHQLTTTDLVPGDLISLTRKVGDDFGLMISKNNNCVTVLLWCYGAASGTG